MASKMIFMVSVDIEVRPCLSSDKVEAVQERLEAVIREKLDTSTLDDWYTVLDVHTTLAPGG